MTLASCILFFSFLNQIDPRVTEAVIKVESSGNPFAVGNFSDVGLMQIRPRYVKESKSQLLQSCTNVMVGTNLLRKAKEKYVMGIDKTWLNCYNLGQVGCRKLRRPLKWRYYQKVSAVLYTKQ